MGMEFSRAKAGPASAAARVFGGGLALDARRLQFEFAARARRRLARPAAAAAGAPGPRSARRWEPGRSGSA